jgi:hypothetical protein
MNKDSKYGEDICRYYDDGYYYVKPCEKGKYCVDTTSTLSSDLTSYLHTCHDIPKVKLTSVYTESCKNSFECYDGLECLTEKCTIFCGTGAFLSTQGCKANAYLVNGKYCYLNTYDSSTGASTGTTYSPAEKNKICGKYNLGQIPGTINIGRYTIISEEFVYKGTVQDGEYVKTMDLCQSGYALYFYPNGKYEDPSGISGTNSRYLRCITPISVEKGNPYCSILYQLDGEEFVYNLNQIVNTVSSSQISKIEESFCNEEFIKIKSERYREFYKNITDEERNTCGDLDGKNKYTCENRELIKSWYFYMKPKQYILYNGREKLEKVLDYLIQMEYPSYYSSSQFLNIQILVFILFFLF